MRPVWENGANIKYTYVYMQTTRKFYNAFFCDKKHWRLSWKQNKNKYEKWEIAEDCNEKTRINKK